MPGHIRPSNLDAGDPPIETSALFGQQRTARHPLSERDPYTAIDDAAIEGCPRIDGPSSVRGLKRPHKRIEAGLADSAQVLSNGSTSS